MVIVAALLSLSQAAAGQWTLEDGTKMSFVFVLPSQKQAWRPNGDSITYASIPKPGFAAWTGKETEPFLVTYANPLRRLTNEPSVRFKLPASPELDARFISLSSDEKIWVAGYIPPPQPAEEDIAIGATTGPWKVVSWVEFQRSGHGVHALRVHGSPIRLSVIEPAKGHTAVNVPPMAAFENVACQFLVKDRNGNLMQRAGYMHPPATPGATTYWFVGDVSNVSQVILQTRRFEWHTIRVAHFKPNSG